MNSINRETIVINLDPAVKSPDAAIDICALGLVSDCKYFAYLDLVTVQTRLKSDIGNIES